MEELNLKQIVEQYPDCLHNSQKLRGLILDLYPECPRGLVQVIVSIIDNGVFQEIQTTENPSVMIKSRWVKSIKNTYGYSSEFIEQAIEIWLNVFNEKQKNLSGGDKTQIFKQAIKLFNEQNYKEAAPLLENLVKLNYQDAFLYLAYSYEVLYGLLFDKKYNNIIELYYAKAAEQGNSKAQAFADYYSAKITGIFMDFPYSKVKICAPAAEFGHAEAQYELFKCYYLGEGGTTKDFQKAEQWLILAANNNFNQAQAILGGYYLFGSNALGIEKNYSFAVELLSKSAEGGNAQAQAKLGYAYLMGKGVNKDQDKAVSLFKLASEKNEPMAQYLLGECCLNGWGILENRDNAIEWYTKSAKNNYPLAAEKLKKLNIELSDLFIPEGTKEIESYAYQDNKILTKLVIPEGVISIGNGAFAGCSNLKHITIPNSVESIGDCAFSDCISLESVVIPSKVKTIARGLFCRCKNLKTVEMPDGIISIENAAFGMCENLENITLPAALTLIGDGAFRGCFALKKIIIPNLVQKIDDFSFAQCKSLREVVYSENLKSIGKNAFADCSSLQEVNLPSNLESVKEFAFADCTALESVAIPGNFTDIRMLYYAFEKCVNIKKVKATLNVVMFLLQKTEQLVDAEIIYNNSFDIRGIRRTLRQGCFTKCNKLSSIILPEEIGYIPELAFAECKNLISFNMNGLESIGREAFKECDNLREISMQNVQSIGESAFEGCNKLIEREKGIEYVGKWVICCDKNTTKAELRSNTIGIAEGAFADCRNLTDIIIPKSIIHFNGHEDIYEDGCVAVFENCVNLIQTENEINYVGKWVIDCKRNIERAILRPDTVGIAEGAFENCVNLKSVEMPNGMVSILRSAFADCRNLTEIRLPESIEYIGDYAFSNCCNLTEVKMPNDIKLLGNSIFSGCEKILSCRSADAVSIEDLDLSVRTYNCLKRAGIHTVSDIQKLSWDDLLQIRNMNEKSAKEVFEKMKIFQK